MNVILVTGSRYAQPWDWQPIVRAALAPYLVPGPAVLIHGAAPGIDTIAERVASGMQDVDILPFPADWDEYPYGDPRRNLAGPKRNAEMLERLLEYLVQGDDVRCVAFHDDPGLGKGTANMVQQAKQANVPVTVHRSDGRRVGA